MGIYSVSRSNFTLASSGNDAITIIPATGRSLRLLEVSISGMGNTASASHLFTARSSGGTTGGGDITPRPLREAEVAAAFSAFTTWAAQPTHGPNILIMPCNSNGGIYRWVESDEEVVWIDGNTNEQISFFGGVNNVSATLMAIIEEF